MKRALLTAALTVAARAAQAQQTQDEILRSDLVRQADQARAGGDHPRALELAARANQIRPTPSLRLFTAQEHEGLGHLVEAYADALACQRAAEVDATLRNRDTILTTCRVLAESLRGRLGAVRVAVDHPPAGFTLRVAGTEVPVAGYGLPRVVVPGAVEVVGDAPGHAPWRRSVTVAAGATVDVAMTLARVDAAPTMPARGVGVGPYVLAGAGVASFVVAGVVYGLSLGARDDRDAACTSRGCLPTSLEHNARYEDLTLATNVALGVGGALVVGGALWWTIARVRGGGSRTSAVRVVPVASAQGAGLLLGGAL